MKKISGSTFYFKKVFPALWFGLMAYFLFTSLVSGVGGKSVFILIAPIVMAVIGYAMFKKMVWDLADEVYDYGDSLEFRMNGRKQRVMLKDIINIDYTPMSSPERVVIQTRNVGAIGKELAFCLPMRFRALSKSPLILELIKRVDNARSA